MTTKNLFVVGVAVFLVFLGYLFPSHTVFAHNDLNVGSTTEATSTSTAHTESDISFFSKVTFEIKKFFYIVKSFFVPSDTQKVTLISTASSTPNYIELSKKYKDLVQSTDPHVAITTLEDESNKNDQIAGECHELLHTIGRAAYAKYGSIQKALQYQSEYCNSGYLHGVLEAYFLAVPNPTENLGSQCATVPGKRPFDTWQCNHGIGHGFMYLTNGDLTSSLNLCVKNLKGDAIGTCENGVYMELFNAEVLGKEPTFIDSSDPVQTCKDKTIDQADCYLYVPIYMSGTLGEDFSMILRECKKAGKDELTCITGVGSEAVNRNFNKTDEVFTLCSEAGSYVKQTACVEGMAIMYMNHEGSFEAGGKLCSKAPVFLKDACYAAVNSKRSFFEAN